MAVQTIRVTDRAATVDLTSLGVAADVAGDKWANDGNECVWILNGGGSPITVTLAYTATIDGQAVTSKTVSIAAGHEVILGPFGPSWFDDGQGYITITYSAITSVKVCVFKFGTTN